MRLCFMPTELFPNPNHNHRYCKSRILAHAEAYCTANGLRFTKLRSDVLMEVAENHKAIGAYQILEKFAERGRVLSPISVYRTLDFLQTAGLIHRLESTNAYFACQRHLDGSPHETFDKNTCGSSDTLIFLICGECGTIGEVHNDGLSKLIPQITDLSDFEPQASQMEISGICRICREDGTQSHLLDGQA